MYRGVALAILVALVLAALYVPVKIPYDLVSVGSVLPAEEWRLLQEAGGGLACAHQNFKTGIVQRLAAWQFERGDLTGMEVTVRPDTFGQVICGDTMVRMYSSIIHQRILELENQLKIKESEQAVLRTGEKPPIVQEAESKLTFALEALNMRQKEFDIAQKLVADGVIADLEFKRATNALELAKINIRTAQKGLEVAQTGVKNESVGQNQTEIASLRSQIAFLRARNAGYVIEAPFDGVVAPVRVSGEVLILQKVSECIVSIPVKTEEIMNIPDTARLEIADPMTGKIYLAHLLARESQTQVLGGRSVAFLKASIYAEHPSERITLGMAARCTIRCGNLNQREYLKKILRFSVKR